MTEATCPRCGKKLIITQDGDGIHTCTPKDSPGLTKAEFDQACVDVVVDSVAKWMQELVRQAMEREYVRDPVDPDELEPTGRNAYLDGRFIADELEAMAWCMRNDKWPRRA